MADKLGAAPPKTTLEMAGKVMVFTPAATTILDEAEFAGRYTESPL